MINELIFVVYTIFLTVGVGAALKLGNKSGLIAYVSLLAVMANIFVFKTITLVGFTATASDSLIMASALGFGIIQERFGARAALQTLKISLLCIAIFTLCTVLHNLYHPSVTDTAGLLYQQLFAFVPRIMGASLVAYTVSQVCNYAILAFLSGKHGTSKALFISAALSQLVDTVVFAVLGLYGVVQALSEIIMVSYCIKLTALLCMGPLIQWLKKSKNLALR